MWGAVASLAAPVVGTLLGGAMANSANVNNAREDRAFQAEQANTAHQREVVDLQKAGLNPLLSVNAGAGGAGGSTTAPAVNSLGNAVTSAVEALRLKKELGQADSQIALQSAQALSAGASAQKDAATAKQSEMATRALGAQLKAIEKEAGVRENAADWDQKMMKFDRINDAVSKVGGNINAVLDMFKPGGALRAPHGTVRPGYGKTKGGTIFDLNTGEVRP